MMTTKKGKTERTEVRTTTKLSPMEEQVVRMREGLRAPDDLVLEQKGAGHPEIAAQLRAIEERALAMVSARSSPAKRHIVSALRRKHRT